MFLSIVFPAYNEEKRIGQTLNKYLDFYKENTEIIVVLNGCQDNTEKIVCEIQKKFPKIIEYDVIEKPSKGKAIIRGFEMAQGKLIGFVDGDGSTSPEEYGRLIKQLNGYDGVIASRWKKGAHVENRTLIRKLMSFGFIIIVKILFCLPYSDTQCGAKIFKNEVIKRILPNLSVANMAFDVELLYQLKKNNYKVNEIPTKWIDKSSSAILGSPLKIFINSIKMLFTLILLRLRN